MAKPEDLIRYLTEALEERDWSQNKLARESHLSPSQVSRVMKGHRPSPEIARAIGGALGVPADYLLRLAGRLDLSPDTEIPGLAEWQEIYRKAAPAHRDKLLKMARQLLRVL